MIKNIFFDFDGVILDSMSVRDFGFRKIFQKFDKNNNIEEFLKYHTLNGGLSRFHKIKYFFKTYLNEDISENNILGLADEFSEIMRSELVNKKYLIKETVQFIEKNYEKYNFYIVSGSEQNELRFLCKELGLERYFKIILGSPIHKNSLVENILNEEKLNSEESILIGDSINDYEAAQVNDMNFFGFNNENLREKSFVYIYSFKEELVLE
ncbi:MAG: HAD family hydrolase [Fusobacteriaceae bacterium]